MLSDSSSTWDAICAQIATVSGQPFTLRDRHASGGGCINAACVLVADEGRYFVKLNRAPLVDMFVAEAEALAEMAATRTVRVPRPLCHGVHGDDAWLVMEYLDLGGRSHLGRFGEQLAAMHAVTADQFGWHRDNTIGSTPQPNGWQDDWVAFFRDRRLAFQLRLAGRKGHGGRLQRLGERLLADIGDYFSAYQPVPSMLHGDLWGGNYATERGGEPVIFDPALYYGDREADIAMTELFGGFGQDFYSAYNAAWPLDDGYRVRKTLYNLYHVLNHLNLFGGGYGSQAEGMLERLLAERG